MKTAIAAVWGHIDGWQRCSALCTAIRAGEKVQSPADIGKASKSRALSGGGLVRSLVKSPPHHTVIQPLFWS